MNSTELSEFLLWKSEQYEHPNFIETDPISIPHHYSRKEDIEIIGLIVATIAWGNRKSIIQSGKRLIDIFGESPLDFVMHFRENTPLTFVHRTFSREDLRFFLMALQAIYEQGALESCFWKASNEPFSARIVNFRTAMLAATSTPGHKVHRHLSNPLANSACKRLNMFLRWMVRSSAKGVDFGLWKGIDASELRVPLDVHTGNTARSLGILQRKQNDWKSSEALFNYCSKVHPQDPGSIDFALFGLGAFEKF
ncbi:MAG: TIGR02757 family protein [Flavobacteriia bacterium]|nr:TIGR02757 family protein [Flavobacteriia bacterium]NBX38364.1 TIGR02757 family protein [Flavobacteriia bacterium]